MGRTSAPINDDLLLRLRSLVLYSILLENVPQLGALIWTQTLTHQYSLLVYMTIGSHMLDCLYLISFGCISLMLSDVSDSGRNRCARWSQRLAVVGLIAVAGAAFASVVVVAIH